MNQEQINDVTNNQIWNDLKYNDRIIKQTQYYILIRTKLNINVKCSFKIYYILNKLKNLHYDKITLSYDYTKYDKKLDNIFYKYFNYDVDWGFNLNNNFHKKPETYIDIKLYIYNTQYTFTTKNIIMKSTLTLKDLKNEFKLTNYDLYSLSIYLTDTMKLKLFNNTPIKCFKKLINKIPFEVINRITNKKNKIYITSIMTIKEIKLIICIYVLKNINLKDQIQIYQNTKRLFDQEYIFDFNAPLIYQL
jgi:hypothetical protein